jgi:hypothetical protein
MNDAHAREHICQTAPSIIDALWQIPTVKTRGQNPNMASALEYDFSMAHMHCEYLDVWCSNDNLDEILKDQTRCGELVNSMSNATMHLGLKVKEELSSKHGDSDVIWVSPCLSCNTPYDASNGRNNHDNMISRYRSLSPSPSNQTHVNVCKLLHHSTTTLTIIITLLRRPNSEMLARLLVREPPAGVILNDFTVKEVMAGRPSSMNALMGVLDNCSDVLPKVAHLAGTALSLVVCRRPAVALGFLDGEKMTQALSRYLKGVFRLVHNAECSVAERFGLAALIHVLPLLYYLADWSESFCALPTSELPWRLSVIMINLLHSAIINYDDDTRSHVGDSPPDLEHLPELYGTTNMAIEALLISEENNNSTSIASWRAELLRNRPLTFAVAASIEVLGHWARKGIPISSCGLPTGTDKEKLFSDGMTEYLPFLKTLISRSPEIAHIKPIAEALAKGVVRPDLPSYDDSILREPLHWSRRCALSTCERKYRVAGIDTEKPLMACTGGCGGLAQYCCREHQRAHWPRHKAFCQRYI